MTQAYIKDLVDYNGDIVYPRTKVEAIYDADGNSLSSVIAYKPVISVYTIQAEDWDNVENTYSFDSEYPKDTYDIEISLSSTATDEQGEAFDGAMMLGVDGTNTVKCRGTVPTIDIPVVVRAVKK